VKEQDRYNFIHEGDFILRTISRLLHDSWSETQKKNGCFKLLKQPLDGNCYLYFLLKEVFLPFSVFFI